MDSIERMRLTILINEEIENLTIKYKCSSHEKFLLHIQSATFIFMIESIINKNNIICDTINSNDNLITKENNKV
jgi:hypothetical protein